MKYLTLLAGMIAIAGASPTFDLKARQDPDDLMIFTCDQMPNVCANMCYGAYCKGIGTSLKYDKADSKEKRNRRHQAGCIASGGNRCSTKKGFKSGYQCDEYPFASTVSNGASTRLNRCVPAAENRKQGGVINAFYKKAYCGGGPCTFTAKFSNAGNINLCKAMNGDKSVCTSDEAKNEEVVGPGGEADDGDQAGDGTDDDNGQPEDGDPGTTKRSAAPGEVLHPRYLTSSGVEVEIPGGARIGQRAVTVLPRNATLWDEQAEGHAYDPDDEDDEYDYMMDNLDVRDDTIVSQLL
ncbi:hypothetical protein SLS54_007935 [Diplodia seriata]